jgi:GNAT superfamily N-acetyltransferase
MNISIRKATESDFDAVFALVHELAVFQGTPERIRNSVQQMKDEKNFFQCFIAETHDKEIVGMASFFFAYYTWVGKSLFLDDLYVKQSHRGEKIGSRLLEAVIELARSSNCKRVRWLVSEWNKEAIKFYKSIGAEIDEEACVCDLEGAAIHNFKKTIPGN